MGTCTSVSPLAKNNPSDRSEGRDLERRCAGRWGWSRNALHVLRVDVRVRFAVLSRCGDFSVLLLGDPGALCVAQNRQKLFTCEPPGLCRSASAGGHHNQQVMSGTWRRASARSGTAHPPIHCPDQCAAVRWSSRSRRSRTSGLQGKARVHIHTSVRARHSKPERRAPGKESATYPWLRGMIPDVPNLHPCLLPQLSLDRILERFARLVKS